MAQSEIRRRAKLVGWFASFAVEVWTLVSWILGEGLEMFPALGPPEYAALAAVSGAAFVGFTWQLTRSFIHNCRPSTRFKDTSDSIQKALDAFVSDAGDISDPKKEVRMSSNTRAHVLEMAHYLSNFKIPHPPLETPQSEQLVAHWRLFLPRLLAASRAGKLKKAQEIWPKIQNPD